MKKIFYPNCSELIADFNVHEPKLFFEIMSRLGRKYKWHFDPPLTLEVLKRIKTRRKDEESSITILDMDGLATEIEYGDNGYDSGLGFRLDSGCSHCDTAQYPFFAKAILNCEAEIRSYDGGNTEEFEKWFEKHPKG